MDLARTIRYAATATGTPYISAPPRGGRSDSWLWTFTGTYDRISTTVFTDNLDVTGRREEARSVDTLANADLLLTGPLLELPAGPVSVSVRGGVDTRDFEGRSRCGLDVRSDLSRDRAAAQVSLDLPLLRRSGGAASPLGNLSANVNLAVERLSDAGTLRTFGYGLAWSPVQAVSLIASVADEEGAPTLEQLGGPLLVTPNVRTFDVGRAEVVDVTRVSGGNPRLRPDDRHVARLGLNLRPLARTDLNLSLLRCHADRRSDRRASYRDAADRSRLPRSLHPRRRRAASAHRRSATQFRRAPSGASALGRQLHAAIGTGASGHAERPNKGVRERGRSAAILSGRRLRPR